MLENLSDVSRLYIQLSKALIFCYQNKLDYALKNLNESLLIASRYPDFKERFKTLISKLQEKLDLTIKKDDIDMSYIPSSLLQPSKPIKSMKFKHSYLINE